MEEENNQINNKENQKIQFSDTEQKEKLILDFNYLISIIESKIDDKKVIRELKKSYSEIENNLKLVLNLKVSKKNIKNYIQLKNSKFDDEIIKLTKYLK
jgi:hypothetical protein